MSYDYIFKVIIIGSIYSGKSAITERITSDRFMPIYNNTIGVDFSSLLTTINNKDRVKIHIWDTAGNESFGPIISSYYKGIAGALIVFDVTDRESFNKVGYWYNELIKNGNYDNTLPILLIGNKIDLKSKKVVSKEEAIIVADSFGMIYCETSAKTGENVYASFQKLIKNIYQNIDEENLGPGIKKHFSQKDRLINKQNLSQKCCCRIS